MKDKFTIKTYFEIWYGDLDEILRTEYDAPDYTVTLSQSNNSKIVISVENLPSNYEDSDLAEFLKTKSQEYYTTQMLLNDLCRQGKIDAGNYLINVSW